MAGQLKWLTILSLDAPLVVVAWQALLAKSVGANLEWHHRLLVFTSVWLGYTADRWFDNRGARSAKQPHAFTRRYTKYLVAVWLIVLLASLATAVKQLALDELLRGLTLVGLALAYTVFAQACRHFAYYGVGKAVFVAVLVTASIAVFLPASALASPPVRMGLLMAASLFLYNCLSIRSWEETDSRAAPPLRHGVAGASLLLATIVFALWRHLDALSLSTALSLIALWLLNHRQRRIERNLARTLADLSLLTPFLFLPLA